MFLYILRRASSRVIFATFAGGCLNGAQRRIGQEARDCGVFDEVHAFDQGSLGPEFWAVHRDFVKRSPRGYGYWLWKPYFALKLMETMSADDILVFADAGCTVNCKPVAKQRLLEYLEMVRSSPYGLLVFQLELHEAKYNKPDLLRYMHANESVYDGRQIVGGIWALRKCQHTEFMFRLWYALGGNYHLIDDSKPLLPAVSKRHRYKEHRHDQAIWSLLVKKYGATILPDETWPINESHPIQATKNRAAAVLPGHNPECRWSPQERLIYSALALATAAVFVGLGLFAYRRLAPRILRRHR